MEDNMLKWKIEFIAERQGKTLSDLFREYGDDLSRPDDYDGEGRWEEQTVYQMILDRIRELEQKVKDLEEYKQEMWNLAMEMDLCT